MRKGAAYIAIAAAIFASCQKDYYSVTRLTLCPAVMLEVGFVSNPLELESLIDKADIQKTALAVTKAVMEIVDN